MKREFLTTLLPNVGTEVINRIPAEHFCVGDRIKLSTVNARKDSLIRAYLQDTVCPALPQQWKVMIKKVRVRDFQDPNTEEIYTTEYHLYLLSYTMDIFRRAVAKEIRRQEEEKRGPDIRQVAEQILNEREKEPKDNDAGTWSKEAREWAVANGIVNGIGDGSDGRSNYAWEAPVIGEQMVTMLYRFEKLAKGEQG